MGMIHKVVFILSLVGTLSAASAASAQITHDQLKKVSAIFEAEFNPELLPKNQKIIINRPPTPAMPDIWWEQDVAHASYSSYTDESGYKEMYLFLFGGYARLPGMTVDGVLMTLCHELGHGIGGIPYKNKTDGVQSSTEGQSDYFAARYCLKRMFKKVPPQQAIKAPDVYTENLCKKRFSAKEELDLCFRGMQALEVERMYFEYADGSQTFYDRPDRTVVSEVEREETFYPSAQCRLDTMMAGILNHERPSCWYVEKP